MWYWSCHWENNASDWKDSHRCIAHSKKGFKNREEAERALHSHERRSGHRSRAVIYFIGRQKEKRR